MTTKFSQIPFKLKTPVQCTPPAEPFASCDPPLPLPELHAYAAWRDFLAAEPFDLVETFVLRLDPNTGKYAGSSATTGQRLVVTVTPTVDPERFDFYMEVWGLVGIIHAHTWNDVECYVDLYFASPYLCANDPHPEAPLSLQVAT